MPNEIFIKPSRDELGKLVDALARASGLALVLVEDSILVEGEYVAMTATSRGAAESHGISLSAIARVLVAEQHEGKRPTWALVFLYIDGRRVVAEGLSHVAFSLDDEGEWKKLGWERDEYNEWEEMNTAGP